MKTAFAYFTTVLSAAFVTCVTVGVVLLSANPACATISWTANGSAPFDVDRNAAQSRTILIDGAGNASGSAGTDVSGSTSVSSAWGDSFVVTFDAAKGVSRSGATLGNKTSDGTLSIFDINANDNGDEVSLGVNQNPDGRAIGTVNNSGVPEGILISLDTSSLSNDTSLQISAIRLFSFADEQGVGESLFWGKIADRTTQEYFADSGFGEYHTIDVSGQDVSIAGGTGNTHVATVYAGVEGRFRLSGLEFTVSGPDVEQAVGTPEPASACLLALGIVLGIAVRRRRRG